MAGVLRNKKCVVYIVGGVEDHLHIIMYIHPSVALASLVKDVKLASSDYINSSGQFPDFRGWQAGYGAFTYSISAKENLVNYVMNQKEHHKKIFSKEEYLLLKECGVEYEDQYLI